MLQGSQGIEVEGMDVSDGEEEEVSDDDIEEEVVDVSMFSMGISRKENREARKPWRTSLIIKLVGRKIGYQYLLRRIQKMWQAQSTISLIDLPNNFFIIRFKAKEDYNTALFNGPWLTGDHYLHVQRWRPNFFAEMAQIMHLPLWVCFSLLPVEYYLWQWLHRTGNYIGKTLKVDTITLLALRGRFARVCVEVDLHQPLKSSYQFKNKTWRVQYECVQVV